MLNIKPSETQENFQMENGDLIFCSGSSYLCKLISPVSSSMYYFSKKSFVPSHVAFVSKGGYVKFFNGKPYSQAMCIDSDKKKQGTRFATVSDLLDENFCVARHKDINNSNYQKINNWLLENAFIREGGKYYGKPYNTLGFLTFPIRYFLKNRKIGNPLEHKEEFFCSELVAAAFKSCGLNISFRKFLAVEFISPTEILYAPEIIPYQLYLMEGSR